MMLVFSSEEEEEGEFMKQLHAYKTRLEKKAKQVRFDDILDDTAPGRMGSIRRKLLKEDRKARLQTEVLAVQPMKFYCCLLLSPQGMPMIKILNSENNEVLSATYEACIYCCMVCFKC